MTPKSTDPWLAPAFAQFETELERLMAKSIPDIEFEGGWEPDYLHVKDKMNSGWSPEQMVEQIAELLKASGYEVAPLIADSAVSAGAADFPHECPKCKGPAYIGFSKVECKRSCK